MESAERSELINKRKASDIRNYNIGKIEKAIENGNSMN